MESGADESSTSFTPLEKISYISCQVRVEGRLSRSSVRLIHTLLQDVTCNLWEVGELLVGEENFETSQLEVKTSRALMWQQFY